MDKIKNSNLDLKEALKDILHRDFTVVTMAIVDGQTLFQIESVDNRDLAMMGAILQRYALAEDVITYEMNKPINVEIKE
jgi:hypothetical protein